MKIASTATITQIASAISAAIVGRDAMENRLPRTAPLATVGVPGPVPVPVLVLVPVPGAADADAGVPDAGVAIRGGAAKSRLAAAAADGRYLLSAGHDQTLRVWTLEAFPFQYAMLQNNLGAVYLVRVAGERRAG